MMKKLTTIMLMIMLVSITGCNNKTSNYYENDSKVQTNTEAEKSTETYEIKSELYKNLFIGLEDKVGIMSFAECENYISKLGYSYDSQTGSEFQVGKITIKDDNSFVLTIQFWPNVQGEQVISILDYTYGKYGVSISDECHDSKKLKYTRYNMDATVVNLDVSSIDELSYFLYVEFADMIDAYAEQMVEKVDIEVEFSNVSSKKVGTGTQIFANTNLPDGYEVIVTLENNRGYHAQDKAVVVDGKIETAAFSEHSNPLDGGVYIVNISGGIPKFTQSENVTNIIGMNGEFLKGKYVHESDMSPDSYEVDAYIEVSIN